MGPLMPSLKDLQTRVRCWHAAKKVLKKVHPSVFHGLYATSHFTYMVLVYIEGHSLYAWVSLPAAIGYAGTFLCTLALKEEA